MMLHYVLARIGQSVIVLERPQSKLLGTVTAMNTFRNIALDIVRSSRIQPDRP